MRFNTDYTVENYIINTRWDDLPEPVRKRAVVCSIDLTAAMLIGSRSRQFNAGVHLARAVCAEGDIPVLGAGQTFNLFGAVTAMAHAVNALDIDDGHNMIKGHPGASFIAGVLAAALDKNITYKDYLTALVVCYETTIRMGLALQSHYGYYHSSGAYGAYGTAAGMGRVLGLSKDQLNTALSIAEYHAPLTPVMRTVEYPSMNKDGIHFGAMTGASAVLSSLSGGTGRGNLLETPEFRPLVESLGTQYEILNLYFKPYTCCRWAHQPIRACIDLLNRHNFTYNQIKKITVNTFEAASKLSKIKPRTSEEAQYNIAYPVACALVHGDVGFEQVSEDGLNDRRVLELMDKMAFNVDSALEARFPAVRLASVDIALTDGTLHKSGEYEASGEAKDAVDIDWISEKFMCVTKFMINETHQREIIKILSDPGDISMRDVVSRVNA